MKLILAVLIATLLFISCKDKNSKDSIQNLSAKVEFMEIKAPENEGDKEFSGFLSDSTGKPQSEEPKSKRQISQAAVVNPDWDKKIIKTALLNIEIVEYNRYNTSLREKVKQLGGYVAQEEQTQSEYKIENILIIKIQVDQFDNAVTQLSADVKKLNEKKITSQDVTAEVVDTKSRLEAKKQVRLRYLDLLKQAKNMEEVLNVQSEINGIQEEIESAAGRINYLQHSSALSTINLTFYQVINATAKDSDKPSYSTKISDAFSVGWKWIGELFVIFVSIWPLLLLTFVVYIFYRKMRKPKMKQA